MASCTLALLDSLASKDVVVILVRRYKFFTKLENLEKPENAGLIGIVASHLKGQFYASQLKHFDLILWFDSNTDPLLDLANIWDFTSVQVPGIDENVALIASRIEPAKLRLITTQEATMQTVSLLCQKYKIPGPTPEDLELIRHKKSTKHWARKHGIAVARDCFLEIASVTSIPEAVAQIESAVDYPLFVKPVQATGTMGSHQIYNRMELTRWLIDETTHERELQPSYIIEELMNEPEFWVSMMVDPAGNAKINTVLHLPLMTSKESLDNGKALCYMNENEQTAEQVLPGIGKFAHTVAKAFQPPAPCVFGLEGFCMKNGKRLVLRELCYRTYGQRGTGNTYYTSGISLETAFLACQLDPGYIPTPDPKKPGVFVADVWFPTMKGTLRSKDLVDMSQIKGNAVRVHWFVDVGEVMGQSKAINQHICYVSVFNTDGEICWQDAKFINDFVRPDVC